MELNPDYCNTRTLLNKLTVLDRLAKEKLAHENEKVPLVHTTIREMAHSVLQQILKQPNLMILYKY